MRHIKRWLLTLICTQALYATEGVLTPSQRPAEQKRTVDVFAESLYWYTSEGANWAFVVTPDGGSATADYKAFTFNWAPGFRVGVGFNMEHDLWDSQVSYTWFQSKAVNETSGAQVFSGFLAGGKLAAVGPFGTGKASINIHYNIFDWDLGRSCVVSKNLSLRPSIGLKGGWINQLIHSYWSIPDFLFTLPLEASETIHHSFQGGGPKGGVTGKWSFGNFQKHFFSLIGSFDASYLWGHWSIRDQFIDSLSTVITIKTTPRNFGTFVVHSFLGLGWECNFDRNRSHFSLKLGYEIEDWFNQFQIYSNVSGAQNNDLLLQGATFSMRFDF